MEHGAKAAYGGKRHHLGRSFFEATVLSEATNDMSVSQEETFGPIAPVIRCFERYFTINISGFYKPSQALKILYVRSDRN